MEIRRTGQNLKIETGGVKPTEKSAETDNEKRQREAEGQEQQPKDDSVDISRPTTEVSYGPDPYLIQSRVDSLPDAIGRRAYILDTMNAIQYKNSAEWEDEKGRLDAINAIIEKLEREGQL